MKVVHLITEDKSGAGRAAIRINNSLRNAGVDSKIVVLDKYSSNPYVSEFYESKARKFAFKLFRKLKFSLEKNPSGFYYSKYSVNLYDNITIKSADIINVHWINSGFISLDELYALAKSKPLVLTLHDMWDFTGGCYYDDFCQGYLNECKECKLGFQNTNKYFEKKKSVFANNTYFVGCSKWITNEAKSSNIISHKKITNIPNPKPKGFVRIKEINQCKKELGVDTNKRIILFGAFNSEGDKRKGFKYLIQALKKLDPNKYALAVFGNRRDYVEIEGFENIAFGFIKDNMLLNKIYNIANVFVAPSLQENLSNEVMEALCSGTPVAAFNIGGMPDMIINGVNGFLANPFDPEDLANSIIKACELSSEITVGEEFSDQSVANRYIELYKQGIKNFK